MIREAVGFLNYRLFHNKVRPDINLLYAVYHWMAIAAQMLRRQRLDPSARLAAISFREEGFYVLDSGLPQPQIREIGVMVDGLLSSDQSYVSKPTAQLPITALTDCLRLCPRIEAFLEQRLIEMLRVFYRAEVQLSRTEIYRLHPSSLDLGHSWLWHFDNVPVQIVKAMVYLTDTDQGHGALSLIPRAKSRQLQRRGFWDRSRPGPLAAELEDPKNKIVVEGRAGTIILFSAHYCLHKATAPRQGTRDAIVFTFQPSFAPLLQSLPRARAAGDVTWAYYANPFTRRPMPAAEG